MDCVELLRQYWHRAFPFNRKLTVNIAVQTGQNVPSSTHSRTSNFGLLDGSQLSLILRSQLIRPHTFGTATEEVL